MVKKTKNCKTSKVTKGFSVSKPFSKSEIVKTISEMVAVGKKQTKDAVESLIHIIKTHLSKKGPGVFVFPGIAKFYIVRKPATKARKGINPFTGEETTFAAKPARNVVKIKALKKLKDIVK